MADVDISYVLMVLPLLFLCFFSFLDFVFLLAFRIAFTESNAETDLAVTFLGLPSVSLSRRSGVRELPSEFIVDTPELDSCDSRRHNSSFPFVSLLSVVVGGCCCCFCCGVCDTADVVCCLAFLTFLVIVGCCCSPSSPPVVGMNLEFCC